MHTQRREFKLGACVDFAFSNWSTAEPRSDELKLLLLYFRYHVSRIKKLMAVPAQSAALGMEIQNWADHAEFQITGKLANEPPPAHLQHQIQDRIYKLSEEHMKETMKLFNTPQWDGYVRDRASAGTVPLNLLATASAAEGGLDAMLSSYIIGAWTIVETILGDLWESALNVSPSRLAALSGRPSRIRRNAKADSNQSKAEFETKTIGLASLQRHGFDVRAKMGTILRQKFEFSRLSGIREAYSCAFDKDTKELDRLLLDEAFDALSAVRNLLVHKAGMVDAAYLKSTNNLRVPKPLAGMPIELDGEIAVGLIKPSFQCVASLILAVDTWIEKNS